MKKRRRIDLGGALPNVILDIGFQRFGWDKTYS